MRERAALAILAGALLLSGASCTVSKQNKAQPSSEEKFLLPKTLFAYGDNVYALDSNADTLETVHPKTSVEKVPFDLPPLSTYRRDGHTEWIVTRPGMILERRIGSKDWMKFESDSRIRHAVVNGGRLYVEFRLQTVPQKNVAKISRFGHGRVQKTWATTYGGMSRSAPPAFLDDKKNLAVILNGEKNILATEEGLQFNSAHDFMDVFAAGWVGGVVFASQGSDLHMVRNQLDSKVDLKVGNWMSVAAEGEHAWVIGTRANRTIVIHYTSNSWSEVDLGEEMLGPHSIFLAGKRACIVTRQDDGTDLFTRLIADGEKISYCTSILGIDVFGTENGVVFADGSWWISPQKPGELVQLDGNNWMAR